MSGTGPESIPLSADPRSKRPTKKRALTPVSAQASHLDALFAHPEQEIRIPAGAGPAARRGALPPEIVTNVQGSSAGAGSGEFHVYKAARRREYGRLRAMDAEVAAEEAQQAFAAARRAHAAEDRARTERNRARREKTRARKEKAKAGKAGKAGEAAGGGAGDGGGTASGGVRVRVVEANEGDEDGEADGGKMDIDMKGDEVDPAAADEPGLLIHDDN